MAFHEKAGLETEALFWGMSELDRLDRRTLLRRWEESERETLRIMRETSEHSEDERRFYVHHGHWPAEESIPKSIV